MPPLQGEPAAGDPARRQPLRALLPPRTGVSRPAAGAVARPCTSRRGRKVMSSRPRGEPSSKTLMELFDQPGGLRMRRGEERPAAVRRRPRYCGHVRLLRQRTTTSFAGDAAGGRRGCVPGWQGRHHWRADFSAFTEPRPPAGGRRDHGSAGAPGALPLPSAGGLLARRCLSNVIHYFRDSARAVPSTGPTAGPASFGTDRRRDVHGGWFDASGDMRYRVTSPTPTTQSQQTPMVVWALLKCRELLGDPSRYRRDEPVQTAQ